MYYPVLLENVSIVTDITHVLVGVGVVTTRVSRAGYDNYMCESV